ncbi:thiolase family protein [Cryobacterium sp. MDB1-18-2]|nr:thiolase family protein [Cryobacterium sp. MDB1-18-2]TFC44118.1 thiolase family protein [Cryobacterium sp. MDB1-18-1]
MPGAVRCSSPRSSRHPTPALGRSPSPTCGRPRPASPRRNARAPITGSRTCPSPGRARSAGACLPTGSPKETPVSSASTEHTAAAPAAEREPVILWGRRTAFGRSGGALSLITADRLLAPVLSAVVADLGLDPAHIDDVIIGNATGGGGNLARLALLEAGFPVSVPGLTVDRQCGSGLEAIVLACRLVAAGAGSLYLAGGVESCSTAPLRAHRVSSAPGEPDFFDRVRFAPDSVGDPDMGVAAENVAAHFGIGRERQDAFAARSHRLAVAAAGAGAFEAEIVGIAGIDGTGGRVTADEGPRPKLDAALLRRFPAAFRPGGTVTAGNSCADADGAVVVLVTSRARAMDLLARGSFQAGTGSPGFLTFVDAVPAGTDPNLLGAGGGEAGRSLLARTGIPAEALARVEIVEAFAAQVLASLDLIDVPEDRANRQGGALALGHPFGASGALIVLRLLAQSRADGVEGADSPKGADAPKGAHALAMVSIAGGLGLAALFRWEGAPG